MQPQKLRKVQLNLPIPNRYPLPPICRLIPPLKNAHNVRVAANSILRDFRDGRIDRHTARVIACARKVANDTLKLSACIDDLHREIKNPGTYA